MFTDKSAGRVRKFPSSSRRITLADRRLLNITPLPGLRSLSATTNHGCLPLFGSPSLFLTSLKHYRQVTAFEWFQISWQRTVWNWVNEPTKRWLRGKVKTTKINSWLNSDCTALLIIWRVQFQSSSRSWFEGRAWNRSARDWMNARKSAAEIRQIN